MTIQPGSKFLKAFCHRRRRLVLWRAQGLETVKVLEYINDASFIFDGAKIKVNDSILYALRVYFPTCLIIIV
jgi:hypothetical protein